ncbi:MAG: hypothetical protein K9W44_15650 [Candidatus Lokiarchaeota archaeon]|nr:hypothetical protein [Candidatus Harpocratesius repetitus]
MDTPTNFLNIISGKFTRRQLLHYMGLCAGLFFALLFISWQFYPKSLNYSILTHTISYLGDYTQNPKGWLYFTFSFIVIGLSFIPLIFYIHSRVVLIERWWGRLGSLFLIEGSIGIIIIAFFPDVHGADFFQDMTLGKAHVLISTVTFLLFSAGFTIYGILFLVNAYPNIHRGKPDLYPNAHTRYVFISFAVFGMGTLITQIISNIRDYPWPGPGIYSFPLWEWLLSFNFFISIYWLAFTLPNKIPSNQA